MLSVFPLDVSDEIWDVIESVSESFLPTLVHCYMLDKSICHFRVFGAILSLFTLFLMENPV